MHRTPGRLDRDSTIQLSKTFSATFLDRTDKEGRDHVAVRLEQTLHANATQEFTMDMDSLKTMLRHGQNYEESGKPAEALVRIDETKSARFNWYQSDERGQSVMVNLVQHESNGKDILQSLIMSVHRLEKVVEEGRKVESKLGYDTNSCTLIYRNNFNEVDERTVEATVFMSMDSEYDARMLVKNNAGIALCPDSRSRALKKDESIFLSKNDTIEVKGGKHRTVADQIKDNEWGSERKGPEHRVAQWWDESRKPEKGDVVNVQGFGQDASGERTEYKASLAAGGKAGKPEKEMFVLLKDDGKQFVVEASDPSVDYMLFKLNEHKVAFNMAKERENQEREIQNKSNDQDMIAKADLKNFAIDSGKDHVNNYRLEHKIKM